MTKSDKPDESESAMDTRSGVPAKNAGVLGKDVQASIGTQLRKHWQKIVDEGVPDRFEDLLRRFSDGVSGGTSQATADTNTADVIAVDKTKDQQ